MTSSRSLLCVVVATVTCSALLAACRGGPKTEESSQPEANTPAPVEKGVPSAKQGITLVDSPEEVGDRGNVEISAVSSLQHPRRHLTLEMFATDYEEASKVNEGNGPWDDRLVSAGAGEGGLYPLANVFFVIEPCDGCRALKHKGNAVGGVRGFRFTRAMHMGVGGTLTYWSGDPVAHNLTVYGPTGQIVDRNNAGPSKDAAVPLTAGRGGEFRRTGMYQAVSSMHDWMLGHVLVSDHAYVGVTGSPLDDHGEGANYVQGALNGTVTIRDVPVGTHQLKVIHEGRLVTTLPVRVSKGQTVQCPPVVID